MEIKSRVPGKIVRFEKQVGDSVEVKDVLIVMEAMKMKQLVPSPVAGVVKEYKVQPGDRVSAGQRCTRAYRPDGGKSARIRQCDPATSAKSARLRSANDPRRQQRPIPQNASQARNDHADHATQNGDAPTQSPVDARSVGPSPSRKPAVRALPDRIQARQGF